MQYTCCVPATVKILGPSVGHDVLYGYFSSKMESCRGLGGIRGNEGSRLSIH